MIIALMQGGKRMDDLISRKQAIDAVLNNEHSTDITLMGDAFGKGYTEGYKEEQNNVLQYLADLPSAQPERKIGHWIEHENADIVEGYYVPKYECFCCHTWKNDDSDYCPDCGADMRGEQNDN